MKIISIMLAVASALLVTGCIKPVDTARPTPLVIYVTPAPPAVTFAPVVTFAPAPTPAPTAAGTSWLTFLTWATGPTGEMLDLLNKVAQGNPSLSDLVRLGTRGETLSTASLAWLASHQPQACWANVWQADYDQWVASRNVWSLLAQANLDGAITVMPVMSDAVNEANRQLDLQTCAA